MPISAQTVGYQDYCFISHMKHDNLLDDIPYKFVKEYKDDDEVLVDMQDISEGRYSLCKAQFTFTLRINVSGGCMPIWNNRTFIVVKEDPSEALYMCDLWEYEYDEEEHKGATTIQALARGVITRRVIKLVLSCLPTLMH